MLNRMYAIVWKLKVEVWTVAVESVHLWRLGIERVGSARPKYANDDQISIFRGYLGGKSGLSILIWPKRQKLNAIQQKLRGRRWCRELPQGKVLRAWNWRQCRSYGGILDGYFGPQTVANLEIIGDHWASGRSWGGRQCDFYGINGGRKRPCIGWVPRSRTRWECDVKASGNDRVIWRVPLHRKSNIIEWVLRLDDFLKQTGSKAILSPRRASGRLVLGWLWASEGKGQDGFDVRQVWEFVTLS